MPAINHLLSAFHGALNSDATSGATQGRLSATTPRGPHDRTDLLAGLRLRVLHLHAAALHAATRQGSGSTPELRQTQALMDWVATFQDRVQIAPGEMAGLEHAVNGLPQGLHRVAGHLAALRADRDEFSRLRAALNGAIHRFPSAQFAAVLANAKRIDGLFPAAYKALDAGHGQNLRDHVSRIRGGIASLRDLLERKRIVRLEDRLPEMQHPDPAPLPATREDHPINLRGGAKDLQRLAQRARKEVLKAQIMTVRQTLDGLNLDLARLASEGNCAAGQEWALATQNGLLRQQARRLDKLSLRLNDNRSFGKNEEAELRQVADALKNARNVLAHAPRS